MMNYSEIINYKIKMLIDLVLTKGVSPSDLADNIFEEKYVNISFSREENHIIGRVNFYVSELPKQCTEMIYTYTNEKQLIRVEESINGRIEILWDRESRESELLNEIIYFMRTCYNDKQINNFIKTLPEELAERLESTFNSAIA